MSNTVLLVEDREDDVFFMRRAWKNQGVRDTLQVVWNGREALAYLTGNGEFAAF